MHYFPRIAIVNHTSLLKKHRRICAFLQIFRNVITPQGSNVFFNCCLDKGAPRLSSQGQNPCKFKRLLMGLFSSWTSCLHRFVSFDHCCILLKRRPRTRDRVQILPRTNSNAQKIRNIFARIGKEPNLQ